jgi:hypothetical protein
MIKKIQRTALFSLLSLGLISVTNHIVLAAARCTINGKVVDCARFETEMKGLLGWGIGWFVLVFAIGIWSAVFWIMMIVHVTKHNVENKSMWIILMVFTGIIGAIVYYFTVKRNFIDTPSQVNEIIS